MIYISTTNKIDTSEVSDYLMTYPQSFREDLVEINCAYFKGTFKYDRLKDQFVKVNPDEIDSKIEY